MTKRINGLALASFVCLSLISTKSYAFRPDCSGEHDGEALATLQINVATKDHAKFERWLNSQYSRVDWVRFGGGESVTYYIHDSTGPGDQGGTGISIGISNDGHVEKFTAAISTCNATRDWKPFWQSFVAAVEHSPFAH